MPQAHPLVDVALEVARLSVDLADALEAGDFDTAERLLAERGQALDRARALTPPNEAADLVLLADARNAIMSADRRSTAALESGIGALRGEMGGLAAGARALRAYFAPETVGPGYVDRHD